MIKSQEMTATRLPLGDLRIVEYGRTCMAAYCGRLMADAGADLIKVEPPEGDPARMRGPFPGDKLDPERSGLFLMLNVNKRGATLDLQREEESDVFSGLLEWAQVLVTDLSLEEERSLGLTWRLLHRRHPHLVVTSITPFGRSGPYRSLTANDHIIYNMGGLGYATPGFPDAVNNPRKEPPLRPSTPIAELIAGATAVTATLLAFMLTRRDDRGRHVEVSAQEAVANLLYRDVAAYSYARLITGRRPVQVALMPNAIMPCKDGYVVLALPWDHMWDRFVKLIGSPDWADLEVFSDSRQRSINWDALQPLLLEWTMRYTGEEIMHMAQGVGLPCFPAFTVADLVNSRHEEERGYFWNVPVDGVGTVKVPGSPSIFSRTQLRLRCPAPRLGEHNDEVRALVQGHAR